MFYETKTKYPTKAYKALSCVLYSVIEHYVCFDYLCFHFKTLSVTYSDKIFQEVSYNKLLGIGITELIMNLLSYHVLMKKPTLTVVLICRSRLVDYYLEKGFVINEHNSNQLSSVPNDAKLIVHAINEQKTDCVMACYTKISPIKNTIKKFQVIYTVHYVYQKILYHDEQDIIDELIINNILSYQNILIILN